MRTKEQVIAEVERLTEIHSTLRTIDEKYFTTLQREAKKYDLWSELAHIYCNMANIYFIINKDFVSAKLSLAKCNKICQKTNLIEVKARYYSVLANLFRSESNFPKAIHCINSSLEVISEIRFKSGVVLKLEFNNNYMLALMFNQLGEMPKYIYYVLRAEKIAKKIADKVLYANCSVHKGLYYARIKKYDLAEIFLEQAIDLLKKQENIYSLGNALNSLGEIYYEQEKYHISLSYFLDSYKLLSSRFPEYNYCFELLKIGDNYIKLGMLSDAKHYYLMAYEIGKELKNKDTVIHVLKGLCQYYTLMEDYKEVIFYRDQIDELRSEIQAIERANKVAEIEEKYQSALKQKEINFRKKKQRETERHIGLVEEQNQLTKSMIALLNKGLKNPVRQGKQMLALLNRGGIRQEDKTKIISSIQEYFEQIEQFSKDVKEIIHTDSKEALGEKLDAATIASLVNKNLSGKKDEFDLDRAKYPKTYFIQEHVSRLAKHAEQSNKIMPLIKGRSSGVLI